jgi:hypothetical protein
MKFIRIYIILGGLLPLACGSEKGVEIAKPSSFVRYYNSGLNDVAKLVKQTPDNGFIILATGGDLNSIINPNGAKVIKTDVYGNQEWERIYFSGIGKPSDVAKDLIILDKGYLLLGSKNIYMLDDTGNPILKNEGNFTNLKSIPTLSYLPADNSTLMASSIDLKDKTAPSTSNFLINGTNVDGSMFLGELDRTTLAWKWGNLVGKGSDGVNDVQKLFLDSKRSVFWSGTVTKSQKKQVRLTSTQQQSDYVYFDNTIGTPSVNQTANDIARFGNGFVIAGETNEKGDNDIYYYLRSENGNSLGDSKVNDLTGEAVNVTPSTGGGQIIFKLSGDESGNSIATSQEGGLLVLGTVDAQFIKNYAKPGNKKEYYLIKVDGFGNIQPGFPKAYGSKDDDLGASLIQANDGSVVVLGTTTLAGVQTLMLMKTDKDGNIQ